MNLEVRSIYCTSIFGHVCAELQSLKQRMVGKKSVLEVSQFTASLSIFPGRYLNHQVPRMRNRVLGVCAVQVPVVRKFHLFWQFITLSWTNNSQWINQHYRGLELFMNPVVLFPGRRFVCWILSLCLKQWGLMNLKKKKNTSTKVYLVILRISKLRDARDLKEMCSILYRNQ